MVAESFVPNEGSGSLLLRRSGGVGAAATTQLDGSMRILVDLFLRESVRHMGTVVFLVLLMARVSLSSIQRILREVQSTQTS